MFCDLTQKQIIITVNITENDTSKIDEAVNGLQFFTYFVIETVLFCVIVVASSIISSHSSDVNFAAFCSYSHSQKVIFQTKSLSHFC